MDEHVTSFNSMTLGDQDARVNYSSTKQEIYREVVDGVLTSNNPFHIFSTSKRQQMS